MSKVPDRPTDAPEPPPPTDSERDTSIDLGGEAACLLHLVCPACGAVITDGHREGCDATE